MFAEALLFLPWFGQIWPIVDKEIGLFCATLLSGSQEQFKACWKSSQNEASFAKWRKDGPKNRLHLLKVKPFHKLAKIICNAETIQLFGPKQDCKIECRSQIKREPRFEEDNFLRSIKSLKNISFLIDCVVCAPLRNLVIISFF